MKEHEELLSADVTFEHFWAEVSYTCPKCGTKYRWDMKPIDVYSMLEGMESAICDKCDTEFMLFEGDDEE